MTAVRRRSIGGWDQLSNYSNATRSGSDGSISTTSRVSSALLRLPMRYFVWFKSFPIARLPG
jgi:hypothetical protein